MVLLLQNKTRAPPTEALYARRKYLKKGSNSVRKGRINKQSLHVQLCTKGDNPIKFQDNPLKTSLYAQPRTMGDTPRRFQDHPRKTVGVVFTRNILF